MATSKELSLETLLLTLDLYLREPTSNAFKLNLQSLLKRCKENGFVDVDLFDFLFTNDKGKNINNTSNE